MRTPTPNSTQGQHRLHVFLAWCWFAFGILGLSDDVLGWGIGIDQSIPVLFFISVYANFTGHLSTAVAAQTEEDKLAKFDDGL